MIHTERLTEFRAIISEKTSQAKDLALQAKTRVRQEISSLTANIMSRRDGNPPPSHEAAVNTTTATGTNKLKVVVLRVFALALLGGTILYLATTSPDPQAVVNLNQNKTDQVAPPRGSQGNRQGITNDNEPPKDNSNAIQVPIERYGRVENGNGVVPIAGATIGNIVYGETNLSYYGESVYVSGDGGKTWNNTNFVDMSPDVVVNTPPRPSVIKAKVDSNSIYLVIVVPSSSGYFDDKHELVQDPNLLQVVKARPNDPAEFRFVTVIPGGQDADIDKRFKDAIAADR